MSSPEARHQPLYSARALVRLRWTIPLGALGLIIQIVTLLIAAQRSHGTAILIGCLLAQAGAAALIALACVPLMPMQYRRPRRLVLIYLWVLNFCVPVGGIVLSCAVMRIADAFVREDTDLPIDTVEEVEFVGHLMSNVSYGRSARLRAQLENESMPASHRMTALLAMQAMPSRTVSPMLRGLLADSQDDIRLLAYGMLDDQEKVLTQRILVERDRLAIERGLHQRYLSHKTLAELYSELVYAQLVQGDVYHNAAEQVDVHAAAALEINPNDAALWRLRGRLALDRHDLDASAEMLGKAIECGFPHDRILPYLAEKAFLQGDYTRTRALLGEIDKRTAPPMLHPVLQYWMA